MTRKKFNTHNYQSRDANYEGKELAAKEFNSRSIVDNKVKECLRKQPQRIPAYSVVSDKLMFYGIDDVARETGWSKDVVKRLFNQPDFPSADFGKRKIVEHNALISYFSVKHSKIEENFGRDITYGM